MARCAPSSSVSTILFLNGNRFTFCGCCWAFTWFPNWKTIRGGGLMEEESALESFTGIFANSGRERKTPKVTAGESRVEQRLKISVMNVIRSVTDMFSHLCTCVCVCVCVCERLASLLTWAFMHEDLFSLPTLQALLSAKPRDCVCVFLCWCVYVYNFT